MIRLRTLGALDLRGPEGQELRPVLAQPKRAALLVYLALATPRGPHRRDTLLALFWPEQDTEHARNALSQAVHFLRRSVGSEGIITGNGDGLTLERRALWCDAVAFEEALDAGSTADALELYRGDLLEGLHVGDAPDFQEWLEAERVRLAGRYAQALEVDAEQRSGNGDVEGALRRWRQLIIRDPYNSRWVLGLMRALVSSGNPGGAVQRGRSHEELLRTDLGIAPDPEIIRFVEAIESGEVSRTKVLQVMGGGGSVPKEVTLSPATPNAAVAVLPFLNLSPDSANEYFSQGITEEILAALAKVPGLRVASRTSAFAFQGQNLDIREIARRLSVRAVLEGSVRRIGNRVRITAQLIDAELGYHLWSENYDRELEDVFAVQEEISRAIVAALELRLSGDTGAPLVRSGTSNVEAYELYLKGRFFGLPRTAEGLQKGIACFRQAVAADPSYALPHSGIADSYHLLALYGIMRAREAYPQAKVAALRAIEIDDRLAEGHSSLGCVALAYDWEWGVAEREFRRAMLLDPKYAPAYHWYAWLLTALSRGNEAAEVIRAAVRLEPLSLVWLSRAGHILYYSARLHEGLTYCERALELDPDYPVAHEVKALIHSQLSQLPQALASVDRLGTNPPSKAGPVLLPYVYATAGRLEEARLALNKSGFSPEYGRAPSGYLPLWVCATYAILGDLENAFRWLEYMYQERSFSVLLCNVAPGFEKLRSDPRFHQLCHRIGLPDPKLSTPPPVPSVGGGYEEHQASSLAGPPRSVETAPVDPGSENTNGLKERALTADELCARGRQGLHQFTEKSFREGMHYAEQAVQLDPANAEAYVTLGTLYLMLSQATREGNPRLRGIDLCRQAAVLDPELAEPLLWLAYAAQLDDRFDEAEALALRGLELDPQALLSHSVLAWVRLIYGLKAGRWEKCVESITSFIRALEVNPRDVYLPLGVASLYRLDQQYCSAQLLLEHANDVERWMPSEVRMVGSLALLGQVKLHQGHLEDARDCLLRAASEYLDAPQIYSPYVNALTHCGLGDLARFEGRYGEAVSHYTRARAFLEPAPALVGAGYLMTRLHTRLAGVFRRLRMRRKEEIHIDAAREITQTREPYTFNWCWGVSESELHYDWCVYHATCADVDRTLRSLKAAVAYGWKETSLIDLEPGFAFIRGQPALNQVLEEAQARPPLPEFPPIGSCQPDPQSSPLSLDLKI